MGEAKTYQDILTEFSLGMNSGVQPLLLPKNQAAMLINATCRGAYVSHRPPFIKLTPRYATPDLEAAVEDGFWQGGGWYRYDTGTLQLVAQISGRLFTFSRGLIPSDVLVAEISITGDLNDANQNQVWMWQSEKWLIITDGTAALPIFYDGMSCRRSYGDSVNLGTVTALSDTTPQIGQSTEATLALAYTGPFNVPVLFNGEYYQTLEGSTPSATPGFNVTLKNLVSSATTLADLTPVMTSSTLLAWATGAAGTQYYLNGTTFNATTFRGVVPVTSVSGIVLQQLIKISGCEYINTGGITVTNTTFNGKIIAIDPVLLQVTIQIDTVSVGNFAPNAIIAFAGSVISRKTASGVNTELGKLLGAVMVPATGSTVTATLSALFSGTNVAVWINSEPWEMSSGTPTAPAGNDLVLINLTDTTVGAISLTAPNDEIRSVPELPAGRMGVYGLGQNWMSLVDGISFIAGDIVDSAAGTQAENYRDAVLKTVGQQFFGGSFKVPGTGSLINSMTFTANLDTSLGQGALQVGTDVGIFSCIAPFDYSLTSLPTTPILTESLIGFGPLSQNATKVFNSDILFRNFVGLGSLVLARRDFTDWGNTPISQEMTRTYSQDLQPLLPFGSMASFDNRMLDTCYPTSVSRGTIHSGLVALNFDLVSTMRGKLPPVYDGLWTGLNILQMVETKSGSEAHAYAFTLNLTTDKIELVEFLKSSDTSYLDNGDTPIKLVIETPIMFNRDVKPMEELVRIIDGELWISGVKGIVNFKLQYRPDFYPVWADWTEFEVCADTQAAGALPGYRTRLGLGEPSGDPCESGNNRPLRVGHFYQFRLEFTGHCTFHALRIQVTKQPAADFAPPVCEALCANTGELPIP